MTTLIWQIVVGVMLSIYRVFFALLSMAQGHTTGDMQFQSSFEQWSDPAYHFVEYLDDSQARVLFMGSEAFSRDGDGQRPTASSGMGYGLLLAYAYDDQALFDRFLAYVLAAADAYGGICPDGSGPTSRRSFFLMPWMVNDHGKPFWFHCGPNDHVGYYSSGSVTDADLLIAWAVQLASERVRVGRWAPTRFDHSQGALSYAELFEAMALEIRLHLIDRDSLIFTPGSQWSLAGARIFYPGALAPQALDALDTAPLPDVTCPALDDAPLEPPNALKLILLNHTLGPLSVDYLGGNGTVHLDREGGGVIPSLKSAVAVFASPNPYYANASVRATSSSPELVSHYDFEFKNGQWTVHDQGSSPESSVVVKENVSHVVLTASDIHKALFPFSSVREACGRIVRNFQEQNETGLIPNVLYLEGDDPHDGWSEVYGYEVGLLPLWVGAYLRDHEDETLGELLASLLSWEGVRPHLKAGSLPGEGVNVFSAEPVGGWTRRSPALNGPLLVAAVCTGRRALADELKGSVLAYEITNHVPRNSDLPGDSSACFNAAVLLLTRAVLEGRL